MPPTRRQPTARAALALLAALGVGLVPGVASAQRSMSQIIAESFEETQTAPPRRVEAPPATAAPTAPALASALPVATTSTPLMPPAAAYAAPPRYPATTSRGSTDVGAGFGQSVGRVIDGLHEMIIPAERLQPIPAADPSMDCVALYEETGRLLRLGNRYRPAFQHDPRNQAIGALGLVHTSVFYLWGVTSYAAWYEDGHRAEARERVGELRRIMADRRCFSRD